MASQARAQPRPLVSLPPMNGSAVQEHPARLANLDEAAAVVVRVVAHKTTVAAWSLGRRGAAVARVVAAASLVREVEVAGLQLEFLSAAVLLRVSNNVFSTSVAGVMAEPAAQAECRA